MRSGRVRRADDTERDEAGITGFVPGGQDLADGRAQDALERFPRGIEVVVDLPDGHGQHGRVVGGPVAPVNEQHAPGSAVHVVRPGQEVDGRLSGQVLIRDDQRNLGAGGGQLSQQAARRRSRVRDRHPVVGPEPPSQVPAQALAPGFVA